MKIQKHFYALYIVESVYFNPLKSNEVSRHHLDPMYLQGFSSEQKVP